MLDVVPWPTPTSATTEATPMITPSIVRAARSRLGPQPRERRAGRARGAALMRDEPPVADVDLAAGAPRRPRRRG